jgi:hypothetical protein
MYIHKEIYYFWKLFWGLACALAFALMIVCIINVQRLIDAGYSSIQAIGIIPLLFIVGIIFLYKRPRISTEIPEYGKVVVHTDSLRSMWRYLSFELRRELRDFIKGR